MERQFQSIIFTPIKREHLEEICSLWNKLLGKSFPMRSELLLLNSFQDINVLQEASWVAINEQGKILGTVIAKIWQENREGIRLGVDSGWIQILLVDIEYQKKRNWTNPIN